MDAQARCSNSSLGPECYEEASGSIAVIVIPALLGISSVFVVSLIFCSTLRKRRVCPLSSEDSPARSTGGQHCFSLGPVTAVPCGVGEALHPWEMPEAWDVVDVELWCAGSYGPVCTGQLTRAEERSTAVVLKTLRGVAGPREERAFAEWILFHATVCNNKSQRLVRMLCCQARRRPMFLVLEAHLPGNLLHFLWGLRERGQDEGPPRISERSVFLLASQVAEGLDYLMTEHRVAHGYVAARNILIGPDLSAKVSGLDTAFAGHQTDRAARQVPLKWLAPERIKHQPAFNRSDVWSFGILLYELITSGSPPYPELDPQAVLAHLEASHRMKQPEGCGAPLYNLMKYCWMWSFKDRPTYLSIIKLLQSTMDLASTEALPSRGLIDPVQYNKTAGIHPCIGEVSTDIKHQASVC